MGRDATGGRRRFRWTWALWAGAGVLLLLPLAAMQMTGEVDWTGEDFLAAAVLLASVCGGIDLAARSTRGGPYVAGAGAALIGGFALVWVNLAVGIVGSEGDPLNLLFMAVVALGLAGAALARFRPAGMALAMTSTALAQIAAATLAFALSPEPGAVYAGLMAAPFLLSAGLFRRAARAEDRAA